MFTLSQLNFQFATKKILRKANLQVNHGEKVAILGDNGVGKSSLFKLLLGQLEPDSGSISIPNNLNVVSFSQELQNSTLNAIDYVIDGHQLYKSVQKNLKQAELDNNHDLITLYLQQLDDMHSYVIPSTAAKLLSGLGFADEEFTKAVNQFSGGWKMRLKLAQTLMAPSDMLLLDEPTNHLDMDAIFFLEDWLNQYRGTLVIISHDAKFMDNVATHVVLFKNHQLSKYTGNYHSVLQQYQQHLALQQSLYKKQQQKREQLEKFITRFKSKASKSKQAQSKAKALNRLEMVSLARVESTVQFNFLIPEFLPDPLFYFDDVKLGFSNFQLNGVSINVGPGERIGIIGKNGTGKSTLLKTITGNINILSGTFNLSKNTIIGYFSQQQIDTLNFDQTPLWHFQQLYPDNTEQEIRNFLGGFGFSGDDVFSQISLFSGGEKAKLILALIIWQKPNLLILDEPTNHLDLNTRHALEEAILAFSGGIIIVSHDRDFLQTCCDQYFLIDNNTILSFDGTLEDYKQRLLTKTKPVNSKISVKISKKDQRKNDALKRSLLLPLKQQQAKLEKQLDTYQTEIDLLDKKLSSPELYLPENKHKVSEVASRKNLLAEKLETLESQWLEISESIENKIIDTQSN